MVRTGKNISQVQKDRILNPPNLITIVRMIGVILIFILLLLMDLNQGRPLYLTLGYITAVLYFILAISDTVDGVLARRYGMVTDFGKLLDPIADKALVTTTAIMLIPLERVPAWIIALIVLREVIITGLRGIATAQGYVMAASKLGKSKTFLQNSAFLLLIFPHDLTYIPGMILLVVALLLTWVSGIDYLIKYTRTRREIMRNILAD